MSTVSPRDHLESVTLVDAENNAIGAYSKLAAHRSGKLHRAFSILITNPDGELLLQRRAAHKYHFAYRWMHPNRVRRSLARFPGMFTPWFALLAAKLELNVS